VDLHEEHPYDGSVEEVFAMLTDEEFVLAKYTELGHRDIQLLHCGPHGDGVRVQTKREVPQEVPGYAKKFVPDKNIVTQTEDWGPDRDGVRETQWSIDIHGAPGDIRGTARLSSDGDGCRNVIDGKVKAGVPIVGGKLEKFVGGTIVESLTAEHEFGQRWLAGKKP
jgi:hypothetical protein